MDSLRSAWEAFHEGNEPSALAVPLPILASWRRSRELTVPPDLRVARLANEAGFDSRPQRPIDRLFASAGEATVRALARDLAGSGCVAVVANATGMILRRAGDREVRSRTDAAQFLPGAAWTEGAAGTNGIGLALALGRPVQVVAAEHCCEGWHDYGCTAAPVRHPVTGEVLGVLTLTTRASVHDRAIATALMRRAALEVEYALSERVVGADRALVERHLRSAPTAEPRLTADRYGNVLLENPPAIRLLRPEQRAAVVALIRAALSAPASISETVELPGLPQRLLVRVALVRWMDEIVGAIATVEGATAEDRHDATLRDLERDAILGALARADGNVTVAAEQLGISRATLYRRLRTYRLLD